MGHCIAATPFRSGDNQAYLGVHFAYGQAPPDAEHMAFVRALQPYLARAVRAQYRLAEAELRHSLYSEALDRVGTGVVVLDATRRLMAAFVFLSALEASARKDKATLLRELFRLTPAEARVAAAMLRGKALRHIAEHHGITYESTRFTLRQVYAKVGVHTQSELVALLGAATRAWHG